MLKTLLNTFRRTVVEAVTQWELFVFRCPQLRHQSHYLRGLVQTLQSLSQVSAHAVLGPVLSQEMINFLLIDQRG